MMIFDTHPEVRKDNAFVLGEAALSNGDSQGFLQKLQHATGFAKKQKYVCFGPESANDGILFLGNDISDSCRKTIDYAEFLISKGRSVYYFTDCEDTYRCMAVRFGSDINCLSLVNNCIRTPADSPSLNLALMNIRLSEILSKQVGTFVEQMLTDLSTSSKLYGNEKPVVFLHIKNPTLLSEFNRLPAILNTLKDQGIGVIVSSTSALGLQPLVPLISHFVFHKCEDPTPLQKLGLPECIGNRDYLRDLMALNSSQCRYFYHSGESSFSSPVLNDPSYT